MDEGRLAARLVALSKKGFGVRMERWFREDLRETLRDALFDGRLAARGYFDMRVVQQLFDEHQSGRVAWHLQLWNLLMLELWHRMFIDQRPAGAPPRTDVADAVPA